MTTRERLLPCPFCLGPVAFHSGEECEGCHLIECKPCGYLWDGYAADPKNECENLEALREKITALWNRRARAEQEGDGWISVSERLPTHLHSVLIWIVDTENAVYPVPCLDIGIYSAKWDKWRANLGGEDDEDVTVTHWMPLPAPPDTAAQEPKFAKTFCSQCGQEFGPGDHGYSHCLDHQGKII